MEYSHHVLDSEVVVASKQVWRLAYDMCACVCFSFAIRFEWDTTINDQFHWLYWH